MSEQSPVYLIAQLEVTDLERHFQEYGTPLLPILQSYGAEVIVATPELKVLEGTCDRNLTAIIKFPSAKAAEKFYQSPEYQPLKAIRLENSNSSNSVLAIAPAFSNLPA